MARRSVLRLLSLVSVVCALASGERARADIAPMPVPFTGACYCHASCAGATGRYRVDFDVGARTEVRSDEIAAAGAQCEKAAKETKFASDLAPGEKTPEELLGQYCVAGGKVAPACATGCANVRCGAKQYER